MANLLQTAMERLAAIQQSHAATSITYRREGKDDISIDATAGAAGTQIDNSTGELSWSDKDWLIPVADLSALGEPERGDQIIVSSTEVYTCLPPAGENCWRPSDNHGARYRIHTKRTT